EDGIRDRNVTGVQTCALPICARNSRAHSAAHVGQLRRVESAAGESRDGRDGFARRSVPPPDGVAEAGVEGEDQQSAQGARASQRSEERRVGKEGGWERVGGGG